jgi:biotin transporter BioY
MMDQSPTRLKHQILVGTTIAFILGFALVIFVLNFVATKVSEDSGELTGNEGLSNNEGSLVIDIAPGFAANHVRDPETIVAIVTTGSQPVVNVIANFKVLVGPTAGKLALRLPTAMVKPP